MPTVCVREMILQVIRDMKYGLIDMFFKLVGQLHEMKRQGLPLLLTTSSHVLQIRHPLPW